MASFFYRTEELRPDEVSKYFVETTQDRYIIEQLKGRTPIILVGSRGVGKSFLFRVAEDELIKEFSDNRVLPIFISFRKSSLIQTKNVAQFHYWMLARMCNEILRCLSRAGFISAVPPSLWVLAGEQIKTNLTHKTKIELVAEAFEESWRKPGEEIDTTGLPTTDDFVDAVEDICRSFDINRIILFIDEAAHVFIPEQQRQFFTLFRDLRTPYITCNAAIYPGVTSFGDTFQPIHDATILAINRDVQDKEYINNMREIVVKQTTDSTFARNISVRGENFAILAYCASGNPRHLFKTLAMAPKLNSEAVNIAIREYYRAEVWSEHSGLASSIPGYRALVDWGRKFIEEIVLPDLQGKNNQYLSEGKNSTSFIWIHRDVPQPVSEALRLLEYTGILAEHASGIRATRREIGKRYFVNLGCLLGLEATPAVNAINIIRNITPKRMSEYGANFRYFDQLLQEVPKFDEPDISEMLSRQLEKSVEVLDLTEWQIERLHSLNLMTVGDILRATESKLQEAWYVGEKRARQIRNTAMAAVFEYLAG